MAKEMKAAQVNEYLHANAQAMTSVEFEFSKAWLIDAGDGTVRIRMDEVPVTDLPFHRVIELLQEHGIGLVDAERYTAEFMELVSTGELARFLARRAKRVG